MSARRSVGRRMGLAALVVSVGVLLSRLLGFVRQIVFAWVLGADGKSDAYFAAFQIPDFINYLLAGGYLSITFIPIFSRHLAADDEAEGWRAFAAIFRVLAVAITALVVVGWIFAGPIIHVVAPGFDAEQVAEAAHLTRIILPAQIFFVLGSLLMSVQYVREKFLVPTLAPVIYNLGQILGGVLLGAFMGLAVEGFAWGVLVGAFVGSFLLQWWGARRVGMRLPKVRWRHPAVPEYLLLALPLMVGQSIPVVDEFLAKAFGSMAATGAVSWLNYGRRLMQVPVGVLAQAAGVAAYPFLARLFAEGRHKELSEATGRALRYVLFASLVAAAGLVSLAEPIVRVAFQRGRFTAADTVATATVLALYGVAVPAWGVQQLVSRGFYARREMWTPVVTGTVMTLVAIPVYWQLMQMLGYAGIAIAGTAAMVGYTALLAGVWYRRTGWSFARPVAVSSLRGLVIAALAGGAAWLARIGVDRVVPTTTFWGALLALVAGGAALLLAVVALGALLRAPEVGELAARFLRRRKA